MFLLRLKQECAENSRLLMVYWLCLALALWSHFTWWFALPGPQNQSDMPEVVGGFSILGICGVTLLTVSTLFKRDDLKCPQDFCATRPIRSRHLYGAKLTFAWLMLALPAGLAMMASGLICGNGVASIWNGLEMMTWFGFVCSLTAVSCMAYPGGGRSWMILLSFVTGLLFTSILIHSQSLQPVVSAFFARQDSIKGNLLLALGALTLAMIWMCDRQTRDKHRRSRPWWFALAGVGCVLFVSFTPLPYSVHGDPTRIAKASKATLLDYGLTRGTSGGAQFVEGSISIKTAASLSPEDVLTHSTQVLKVEGIDEPWFTASLTTTYMHHPTDHEDATQLKLNYTVYDQTPDLHQGISSSSVDNDFIDTIAGLPKRKIRIVDTLRLHRQQYKEIHRSPLKEPFSINHGGLKLDYLPASIEEGHEHVVSWKSYSPSLLTQHKANPYHECRFFLEHPDIQETIDADDFDGGGGGTGSVFGRSMTMEYDLSNKGIRNRYIWHDLDDAAQKQLFENWEEQATLIVKVMDRTEVIEIPIDVEIEIPDPKAIRQLLIDKKL